MHGRYASFYVNKGITVAERVYSYPFVYIKRSISPMHHKSKQRRQKAWDDGVAPGVYGTGSHHPTDDYSAMNDIWYIFR